MSPLAPGQWKGFLAVYAGFYLISNIVRPLRLAAAVAISPKFDQLVSYIQRRLQIPRGAAIGVTVFSANLVGTCVIMASGICLASLAAGVPVFPLKI